MLTKMEQYKRNLPNTVSGESIQITITYSSFNATEIDVIEKWCKDNIGYARLSECKTYVDGLFSVTGVEKG